MPMCCYGRMVADILSMLANYPPRSISDADRIRYHTTHERSLLYVESEPTNFRNVSTTVSHSRRAADIPTLSKQAHFVGSVLLSY
jgi:hypothetical protein